MPRTLSQADFNLIETHDETEFGIPDEEGPKVGLAADGEAATALGTHGIVFTDAPTLRAELALSACPGLIQMPTRPGHAHRESIPPLVVDQLIRYCENKSINR